MQGESSSLDTASLHRRITRLSKDYDGIAALDFFPGAAREQAESALAELERSARARLLPDEPRPILGRIRRLPIRDYQGRLWATRRSPWIDRLASAWLIRRFIDPRARYLWMATPDDCPDDAVGFDFDGAAVTHLGARVTYEMLLASFGLTDPALQRIGALVDYLDAGGIPIPEAAGIEALMRGLQQRWSEDDALLAEAEMVFDALYLAFSGNET